MALNGGHRRSETVGAGARRCLGLQGCLADAQIAQMHLQRVEVLQGRVGLESCLCQALLLGRNMSGTFFLHLLHISFVLLPGFSADYIALSHEANRIHQIESQLVQNRSLPLFLILQSSLFFLLFLLFERLKSSRFTSDLHG